MQLKHIMIAFVVAFTWGFNFIATKIALEEVPVFLLLAVRFVLSTLPFIFFIPRPKEISWKHLISLSVGLYILKFSFVFGSIAVGLSPGISSLALQTQAIFTMLLSAIIFKSKISTHQIIGMAVAFSGMVAIGLEQHGSASFLGFILILCGALMWGASNILLRGAKDANAFALTIWMGIFPPIPLFSAGMYVDSFDFMIDVLKNLSLTSCLAIAYNVAVASWIGATCWNYLFKKYDAAVVAPYSLLIPIFGITCSWLFLGERYSTTTICACLVVLAGLAINQLPIKYSKKHKLNEFHSKYRLSLTMREFLQFLRLYMLQRITKIIVVAIFFAVAIGAFYGTFSPSGPFGISSNQTEVEIYIPEGTPSFKIAQMMVEQGVLSHPYGFVLRAKLLKKLSKLQAGEYLIPPSLSMDTLIDKIASGEVIHRSITVPEGVTVAEVIKKLNEAKLLEGELQTTPAEGSLLPATYPYHRGEKREDVLKRMQKAMDQVVAELWKEKSDDCLLQSPFEAVILASIIEKETSRKIQERPRIAGVFFKRIATNMRLQSDPTVIYGLTLGKKQLGRLLCLSDLTHNSPFNTYKHFGLPPTPIACPSKDAIKAALCPEKTDEIFFVADGTGGHSFAKTLAEHNKNVQKWRQICSNK